MSENLWEDVVQREAKRVKPGIVKESIYRETQDV
jgi:hypothetical protein